MKSTDLEKSIVATSTELFLTLGFKSVTMDDIAEEMKISKKTIYTFFTNKEALVQSVVFSMYNYITTNLTQIREKANNPISELYEVKMFIMNQLKGEKTSPQHQLRKYYPNIHNELQKKQFDYMTKSVGKSLIKGVIMKLFRPSIDIDFISRMYFVKSFCIHKFGHKNVISLSPSLFGFEALYARIVCGSCRAS